MEELQKAIVEAINEALKASSKDVQLLDALNRLLGTVSSFLMNNKK